MRENLQIPKEMAGQCWLIGGNLSRFTSHHHDELEINLVISGKAHYLFEHRRVAISAGSLIWIFPRQEHVLFDWSHDFSMWVLVFKPALVRRLTKAAGTRILRSKDPGSIFSRQISTVELERLGQIYHDAARNDDVGFAQTALPYALARSWQSYQFSSETLPRVDVHPAVGRAARLLSLDNDPVPLPELARQSGLSPARLSRLFKQQVGLSLTAFRQRECLKRFVGLYQQGGRYSLIEAALLAGFGSYPQFHRVFTQVMNVSPAEYRKSVKIQPKIASA